MSQIEKRINSPDTADLTKETPELMRYLKNLNESLMKYSIKVGDIFNKGIRVEDNINGIIQTVTFNVANNEYEISHGLKRVPNGFIILNKSKASDVYDSGTAWTLSSIYLKCDTAGAVVKLIVL